MEGTGGVVAVVQGLQDAGLAITLLSQRYQPPRNSVLAKLVASTSPAQVPAQACQTVADSATETVVKDYPQDTLYRSSYQLSHCQPTASPGRLPQHAFQRFQYYRSSTSRSHDEELFVDSLRKYPIAPARSRSADLIERMLSYTQSKNGSRNSNIRSAKSLPSKDASKVLHADEIPTRDTGNSSNELRPNFGYKRDVDLVPVPTGNRKSRYDNQTGMYDYLKSSKKEKKLKGSDVRYLTNVKQCLKERLRQLCDEEPATICQKIQNRYSQHRKQYHRTEASEKSQKCTTCKENVAQDALRDDIQAPSTSGDRRESRERRSSSSQLGKACFCGHPAPCDCEGPSRSILKPNLDLEITKRKPCISICEYECNTTGEKGKTREIVMNWLQEVPVYANFSPKDAMKRDDIINKLINNIGQFEKDGMYFDKVENEIRDCLKVLPMWRPENKSQQESFEDQLTNNLLQKLKGVIGSKNEFKEEISKWVDSISFTRNTDKEKIIDELNEKLKPIVLNRPLSDKDYKETLKSEVVSYLRVLPIDSNGSTSAVIDNMADTLVEKISKLPIEQAMSSQQPEIKSKVMEWIKDIPNFSDNITLKDDDYVLVNDLIARLNNLKGKDINDRKQQMNDVIINWLSSLEEKKKSRFDRNAKNLLTDQLIKKIIDSEVNQPRDNLIGTVQKWFDDIPDTLGVNSTDNRRDLEALVIKLQDLQTIKNDENRQNTMRQEILKWVQNLQRKHGRYIDNDTQENLVNKLVNMIKNESSMSKNIAENCFITEKIWEWLESQPEFKQNNSSLYKDVVMELSKKLQDIKDNKGELTEYDVKAEVTNWFEKLSQEHGIQIEPNNRKQLQDKLLSSISPIKRRKNWEKPNNIQEIVSKEVSDIINDRTLMLDENDKKQLKDKIIQLINQDWDAIHYTQSNKPISKIVSTLKQATSLPEAQLTRLAQTLIEKIKQAAFSNLNTLQEGPIKLDITSRDTLKSKVENILKKIPLKDKQQVVDEITATLVHNYDNNKTDSDFDVIYDTLKKANVSESEARDVTNKILDMSNQFRSEITDTYQTPSYGSAESLRAQKQIFMQRLEREITDFMEKVLNESSSFYKNTHPGGVFKSESVDESSIHYNKFKGAPFKASTPRRSDVGRDMNIETQYKNQIKEIITKWIDSLGIDDIVDDTFKSQMANDIATDIIDRQRYIQMSNMKRSSQDEMEHLKYQVFKWTSKLPNVIDLAAKTDEIKMLIRSLKDLEVPNLSRMTNENENIQQDGTVTFDTTEIMEDDIYGAIWNWLNNLPTFKPRSSADRRIIDNLITDLSKKLKNILESKTNQSDTEKLCKDEVLSCFKNLNRHLENTEEKLERRASELMNNLKGMGIADSISKQKQDSTNRLRKKETIKKAVENWCQKLPLRKSKTFDDIKDIVENLAEAISRYLLITDAENVNKFMDDILNNLKKLPLQFDKEDSKRLPEFTEELIDTLKGVLNDSENYYSPQDSEIPKPAFKKAAEIMYDNIQKWCENLPLDLDDTTDATVQANLKQNLAGKLVKKVGEINLDPEIFHDDYLYEDVLKDEIENILDDIPKNKQLEEVLPSLKENLVKNLLEVKGRMKNEIAGFAYKQQLRDAISKTLSSIGLSTTEDTPFEVLKDNLADAFISLHYVADEDLKNKFKDKIFDEVNKFCDDYLKRYPSTPLNAQQLNQELYKALKKVPVPKDDSMRREVEQIRVKDIVADWFKDLPLKEPPSPIQKNKIISIIAKRLHEIENEAELNPSVDVDEAMNNEITKWLKKFQLKTEIESDIKPITKSLIDKVKATKESRKFDESTVRKSINYADLRNDVDNRPSLPLSNLSAEDRAHLQRIKKRMSIDPTISSPGDKKDASVSPAPIAAGVQTEEKLPDAHIGQKISQNASIQTITRDPEAPTSITPQVIVKEYYWNSQESPPMQRSGSILSYMQSPVSQPAGITQRRAESTPGISCVTTATQTIHLPSSKGTITQEMSMGHTIKSRPINDNTGNLQNSGPTKGITAQQKLSTQINIEPIGEYTSDDYLRLNSRKRAELKSCKPCREQAVLSTGYHDRDEAGTSKDYQQICPAAQQGQATKEKIDGHRNRPELLSAGQEYLNDQEVLCPPCFRRSIYQTPTRDIECPPKRRRKNLPCSCRNPVLTKCTIRPQSPCQLSRHSKKSCYVSKSHCPKCWDGFCPHPSYLYFRQD